MKYKLGDKVILNPKVNHTEVGICKSHFDVMRKSELEVIEICSTYKIDPLVRLSCSHVTNSYMFYDYQLLPSTNASKVLFGDTL